MIKQQKKDFQWFMVKPYTSDIRMAYEYIKVKYGWHKSDIRMTYDYIRVTCGWHTSTYEWHTDDIRVHTSLFNTLSIDKVSTRSNRQRCSVKNMFLEISQNLQENTCARASFSALSLQLYQKRGSGSGAFLWILWNF